MIDQVDQDLAVWVRDILGDVDTRFDLPGVQPDGKGVVLYLLSLAPTPPASTLHLAPLQFYLRYLITTWAETTLEAHRLLGELILAAMENGRPYEVDLDPVPPELWMALQLPPQPAFVLRALVRKARPEAVPKLALRSIIDTRPGVTLFGLVQGPGDIPMAQARVELPYDQRSTYTDSRGRFRFDNLPAGMPISLRVRAKGKVVDLKVEQPTSAEDPVIVSIHQL
jgi:hypothetical protein